MIEKYKPNTGYNWERMDETIMNIEREFHSEDPEPNSDDLESVLEESAGVNDKDLPKNVVEPLLVKTVYREISSENINSFIFN